jgi:hypothetical protein
MDSNHRRHRQQIYSLPPLATRVPHQNLYQPIASWRWDLNPQPADYKSAALPLSYASIILLYYQDLKLSSTEKYNSFQYANQKEQRQVYLSAKAFPFFQTN